MVIFKKTAAYYRNSADAFQENSITLQIEQAIRCATEHFLTIDEVYPDNNTSAVKNPIDGRKELKRLLKDIQEGIIGTLIVYKRDRIARRTQEYMEIYEVLKKHNITVYFSALNEFPMLYSPQAFTIEYLLASFCEHEEIQMKERISDSNAAKFKDEKRHYVAGSLPFGYSRVVIKDDNDLITNVIIKGDEKKLEIVRRIYDTLLTGNFDTMHMFRDCLVKNDIRRGSKNMSSQQIQDMIRRPLYKGIYQMTFNGTTVARDYSSVSIVTFEEWERAQLELEKLAPTKVEKYKPTLEFMCDDILHCNHCDRLLKTEVRNIKDEFVGFYYCKPHKVEVEKERVEEYILTFCKEAFIKWIEYFDHPKVVDSYKKSSEKIFNSINNKEIELMETTRNFIEKTSQYMFESNTKYKEILLIECNVQREQIVNLRNKINSTKSIQDQYINRLRSLKDSKAFFKKIDNQNIESIKKLIKEIVIKISITKENQPFVISKHPFTDLI